MCGVALNFLLNLATNNLPSVVIEQFSKTGKLRASILKIFDFVRQQKKTDNMSIWCSFRRKKMVKIAPFLKQ